MNAREVTFDFSLACFFLGRLARLAARQARAGTPEERIALAHAVFSVFLDCADLGLEAEARTILGMTQLSTLPNGMP